MSAEDIRSPCGLVRVNDIESPALNAPLSDPIEQ
jgi:hypothetical protein